MIYAGNREVKEIWAGGRPAVQAWAGGTPVWGGEEPSISIEDCTVTAADGWDGDGPDSVTVVDPQGRTLVENVNYDVSWTLSGSTYEVTVTGIGSYTGSKTVQCANKTSGSNPVTFYKADPQAAGDVRV